MKKSALYAALDSRVTTFAKSSIFIVNVYPNLKVAFFSMCAIPKKLWTKVQQETFL